MTLDLTDTAAVVAKYDRMIWRIVANLSHLVNKWDNYGTEDAYQDGVCGLLKAIRTYDPDSGATFTTYAWPGIENGIRRGAELARGASYRRAARRHEFHECPSSLDAIVQFDHDGKPMTAYDVIADLPTGEPQPDNPLLAPLLARLNDRDRIVVTMPSIVAAEALGIKQASVHRRRARIYDRLRAELHNEPSPTPVTQENAA